ncbi:response regulator, partial [Erythrobacter sp. HI0077]|uniref:response regulator n=1 Tax=Erythrobacter sp. HI0077 TaxID=1822252 RepID=UPI002101017F
MLVEILKFRLEGAGHSVSVAKDGEEALAMVQSGAPQLIVLDSMMPILSGPEVLAQLKSDEAVRDIPVVMLTAR